MDVIFSGSKNINGRKIHHIEMILNGLVPEKRKEFIIKSQTRRLSDRYIVGHEYSIQSKRTARVIPGIKIHIDHKWKETKGISITKEDAWAEGGYTPQEYEDLFERMYPGWKTRWAYVFHPVFTDHISLVNLKNYLKGV